ncbi:MAG: pullulanase-type alpha-1,6-glucosidase [Chloroflexi bacterium]|nr:pullulanase-type alpha-1,6-glucosidase [Chloroflexota bacterium]
MRKNILHILVVCAILTASFSPVFASAVQAQSTPSPDSVNIPGTHQDELGCSGEWQPDCENTQLTYDLEDDIWQGTYEIQPANDADKRGPRYKAALNGSWGENYGLNASGGGADIPLLVTEPTQVKFYYDHKTHWITDSFNTPIVVVTGNFQQQLGCAKNDDASCLRSWLQDPEGSGAMGFVTNSLKAGTYSATFTLNEDSNNKIGEAQQFTVRADGDEIYFGYDSVKKETIISTEGAPKGSLSKLRAHWVSRDTILWNVVGSPKYTYSLFYSPDAALELSADGIKNGTEIPLTYVKSGAKAEIIHQFPHLGAFTALTVGEADWGAEKDALKGQVAVLVRDANGKVVDVSGVQIPGVLDDLYQYEGSLGVTFESSAPTLRVWAPTAQSVTLNLFDTADSISAKKLPMQWDSTTGVWSINGDENWNGKFYLYEVTVYVPSTGKIETNLVTDPYSLSLSMNSKRSQIVDLTDANLKPQGWDETAKPALAAPEDMVLYELHIRDFSISDRTVPEELRGTYKAFTVKDSNGMKHLIKLAQAGLTHIHLLPVFDIASVNEDKSTWKNVDETQLASYPPDSNEQSKTVSVITGADGFNWGYDPLHYTTPEGSYATDPNGTGRIVEFREMIQSLNQNGLRVVMDVVYNHTNASGQSANSVLDKVVPGYYHRLNNEGSVEKSTCCQNTATEHEMMRKLMIDSVVTWATEYKVDGFRFDLMGHHMLEDMKAVRAALDALTLEKDGVDGKSIYIYGEGWDFGEVANNARGQNATQLNIAGTGIGVFNDRLRDAARGGNPFNDPREQGFTTGLFFSANDNEKRTPKDQLDKLNSYTDWIRLGLAANLADYEITRANGDSVPANLVLYGKVAAGYTADPQENIVYVSAHDNQTLFDAIQIKAPVDASLADRIRMNNLALSLVMFSQGIPFFHAGDDILRSKSLDTNSYNSGDWYNKLDWTYVSNNWGVGLPLEGTGQWEIYKPLLADPKLAPAQADIESASAVFREYLGIRKSSPLFRLQTGEQIKQSVSFLNTGTEQVPGLIVLRLNDAVGLDANVQEIMVLFNARPDAVAFSDASFSEKDYALHAIQQNSVDTIAKSASFTNNTFNIPARTTAVFVLADPLPAETAEPSPENSGSNFTLATILGVVIAISGIAFFLRRRRKA